MNFSIKRTQYGLYGVFGELKSEDGKTNLYTLEHGYKIGNDWFPKVAAGTYTCKRYDSPDHGYEVFVLEGVPPFQGAPVTFIEIHIGNHTSDSEGCILVGCSRGAGIILDSRIAFENFMEVQKDVDSFTLTIV